MAKYIYTEVTKDAVKALEPKQTVIVEDLAEGKVKTRKVYLANWKDRRHAFAVYQANSDMKTSRKDKVRRFRLLKLHRLLDEVKVPGYNTKTIYYTVAKEEASN